jgi:hypothetical protein
MVVSLRQTTFPTIYTGIHNSNLKACISLPFQCTVGLRNRHVRLSLIRYEQAAHADNINYVTQHFAPSTEKIGTKWIGGYVKGSGRRLI